MTRELEEEKSRIVKAHDGTVQGLREQLASEGREVRIVEQGNGYLCVCVCVYIRSVHVHVYTSVCACVCVCACVYM